MRRRAQVSCPTLHIGGSKRLLKVDKYDQSLLKTKQILMDIKLDFSWISTKSVEKKTRGGGVLTLRELLTKHFESSGKVFCV